MGGTAPQTKLQLALDHVSLELALGAAAEVADFVDVMEVGTILGVAEGISAITILAGEFPFHLIAADLRIVRAGRALAELAFAAGADWLSVMAAAPDETIAAVVKVAEGSGGRVQAELDDHHSADMFRRLSALGVHDVIVHRSHEAVAVVSPWSSADLERLAAIAETGLELVVTGGITVDDLQILGDVPVSVFIAGRSILAAATPRAAASQLRTAVLSKDRQ